MPELIIESVPSGAEVRIDGEYIGTTTITHPIGETTDLTKFRSSCLSSGNVVCSNNVLKARLEDHTVSKLWWDLTRDERYSIARKAESIAFGYFIEEVCCGTHDCGGCTDGWKSAACTQNGAIRTIKFSDATPLFADSCYYRTSIGESVCWLPEHQYALPSAVVTCATSGVGYGHTMCAIQIDEDQNILNSWAVFDSNYFDVTPGHLTMPNYKYDDLWVKMEYITNVSTMCGGYGGDLIAKWHI